MENKQKAMEMAAAMQQKEKSGSLLWCVAEDLFASSLAQQLLNTNFDQRGFALP